MTAITRAVDGKRRPARERYVAIRVVELFRGPVQTLGREAVVVSDGPCSYSFKADEVYLVYARAREDGRLTVTTCSRTAPIASAQHDLSYARDAAAGRVPPGRLAGTVRQAAESGARTRLLAGVPVLITGPGEALTTSTDARGRYSMELPGAGIYRMDVRLPPSRYWPDAGRAIEVPDARGCVEANIEIRFNGELRGRVADADGRGVAGITVSHEVEKSAPTQRIRTLTADDGGYRMTRVPPGPFAVRVELPLPQQEHPLGTSRRDSRDWMPIRGVLGGGHRLELQPLVLGRSVPIVRIEGMVAAVDGGRASGALVFLRAGDGERSHVVGEPAVADGLGRFVLAAVEGQVYEIFAERVAGSVAARKEFSLPTAVAAHAGMPPVRLTLRRPL